MLDKMAKELTDDTIVIEAPSFIVPYIYEKPPLMDINFNDVLALLESSEDQKQR